MNRVLDFLCRVIPDVVHQATGAATDKSFERIPYSGDCSVVEPNEAIGKRDQYKEANELRQAESGATLRGRESFLDSKPNKHDGCQRDDHPQTERVEHSCREVVTSVFNQYQKIHCWPPNVSIVKAPSSSGIRLLGHHVVDFLLITVARLKQRLQIVLLNLLANYQLKGLSLKDLVCLLLNPQFDKEGLVDPLERSHFCMLRRIGRMRRSFQLADICFASCGIRANCSHGL